jgi:preprotein translocase subunit SecD
MRRATLAVAAGLALALAGCSSALPVGPAPAPLPTPTRLATAIVMLPGETDPTATPGRCLAGEVQLSGPGVMPAGNGPVSSAANPAPVCFRKQGQPLTVTSAGVVVAEQKIHPVPGTTPANPVSWVVRVNLPSADAAALASITTRLAGTQDQLAIIVDGQTWGMPVTLQPLTHGQFVIGTQGQNQALTLQRLLTR